MIVYGICLCLTYFTYYGNLWVHPCYCKWHHFISCYGSVIFHCVYTPHLLRYSSVESSLGCFDILATVNSAALNTGMHVSFQIRVFHRYMSKNGIAESYHSSIFRFFEEPQYNFPERLNQFIYSSRVWEDSLFCTPFPAFVIWRLFNEGHFDWFEMISHCSFDLNFSNN